ncbi:MAG: hypothetical protein ACREBO_10985 [Novosphingobium sp.]
MRTIVFTCAAVLALAACSGGGEPSAAPSESIAAAEPTSAAAPTQSSAPTVASIPEALHGRWGLVPADCTSTRGDTKGLLTIDGKTLKFYESVGKLGEVTAASDNSLRASFTMQGEGMEWVRDMELAAAGDKLTRREFGAEAAAEAFVYTRC